MHRYVPSLEKFEFKINLLNTFIIKLSTIYNFFFYQRLNLNFSKNEAHVQMISEKFNSMIMTNSSALTATRGSYFLAPQFTGFLRCSVYGNISNITISKSTYFLVRNQNGTKILEYDNGNLVFFKLIKFKLNLFSKHLFI